MAVDYNIIRPEFERLRDFITNDLDLLISQEVGGNYIAASLIVCACDALGRFRYGCANRGDLFFKDMMLPENWRPVGKTIYDAIRNGIVHSYETKDVVIDGLEIEIELSWKHKPHLELSSDRKLLYVNIQRVANDLKDALNRYEEELKENDELRDTFYAQMKKLPKQIVVNKEEKKAWAILLKSSKMR